MLFWGLVLHLFLLFNPSAARIGYFWHITDIHYNVHYSTSGDTRKFCRRTENKLGGGGVGNSRPAGRYGDYNCDSPWPLVESAAKAMKSKHGDNIEFVLWTGDGVAHSPGVSGEHQLEVLQNLTHLLRHTFRSQFVFPVLGHDDPNPGLHFGQGYKDVATLWRHWLPTEAIQTFNKGGYYTIEQKVQKLRLVMLNTNLCSDIVGNEEDPAGQWAWLDDTLQKSQGNRETVYLVGHMPPGVDERQNGGISPYHDVFQERFNQRYLKLVRKYSDIIVGQFFGHLHSDSFRIVYSDTGHPVSWIFIAPAVSPKRTPSGANNPGLRLYKFDTDTGQVLDYRQYYLDLNAANLRNAAEWLPEYNLTDYYGLNEVSASELHNLVESFGVQEGSALFSRYYRANSVKFYHSTEGCDASCAHTHYCAITRLDYPEFHSCLETAASALASAGVIALGIHWSLLILPLVVLGHASAQSVLMPSVGALNYS
ncbi:acid sphingomyelinase-like phosphodiesterase 3a [Cryptotermes secundus]|nr:acid sphingomyelinase-like phosphodiesterase 3a [Cryptotermes secundus]XP_023719563.1 acid sphingomyelinase-like phosphodiesterase 3a [Cryptotermes secundus]XP_023719564.1 acid sphingomyelinase-like phosphodiesterase 3a [Cryptotermes secundus]XP_023719565.1 acid sphingomyelinase-like phosphodiesterase 3a [Cryptotermes secundus]XP_023719567.1 acid sphingomyelinase-like phosphodiesterase 3a [Cryptotermes secundus]XP_023719571.1 acid sphingomyelinase-like phosphodiesterase 3a [Cryptotermes sec